MLKWYSQHLLYNSPILDLVGKSCDTYSIDITCKGFPRGEKTSTYSYAAWTEFQETRHIAS